MAQRLAEGGRPKGQQGRIALPVAGDDLSAKQRMLALLDALGFDGLDAGTLRESWHQQLGTPVYCTDLDSAALPKALASANRAAAPQINEEGFKKMMSLPPGTPAEEVVRQVRAMWPGLPQN